MSPKTYFSIAVSCLAISISVTALVITKSANDALDKHTNSPAPEPSDPHAENLAAAKALGDDARDALRSVEEVMAQSAEGELLNARLAQIEQDLRDLAARARRSTTPLAELQAEHRRLNMTKEQLLLDIELEKIARGLGSK